MNYPGFVHLFLLGFLLSFNTGFAQLSKDSRMILQEKEDTLKQIGYTMLNDTSAGKRIDALHKLIPVMVRALKVPESFFYPFDSLNMISVLYAPDSNFRILTWQLHMGKGVFRYYGAIQMNSENLQMYPLFDVSDTIGFHSQAILDHNHWFGCLYYKILKHYYDGKYYYTLLGYDANDILAERKLIDVLWFDENRPKFGAPIFHYVFRDGNRKTLNRIFIDYKFDAKVTLNYDTSMSLIVYDHTSPPDTNQKGAFFVYVPDGTYEGFKWTPSGWQWVEQVFHFAINQNDNPPMPKPIFGGKKDERFK